MSNRKRKKITSADVAKVAGVSRSTVSLVLNDKAKGRVSEEKRAKVLEAASQLSYRMNAAARSLRLGNSNTIGLFVPNVLNPFFGEVLRGAQKTAYKAGYNVLLINMMENPEWQKWMINSISALTIDGCILYLPELLPPHILKRVLPFTVLVEVSHPDCASLLIDIEKGATAAMEYLIGLGHMNIAFLDADYKAVTFQLRTKAYKDTLAKYNIPITPSYITQTKYGLNNAKEAALRILSQPMPPTAIFCAVDSFAPGVYKAAKQLGLNIPRDLSVVGYDNGELANILEPELTSIAIPAEEVGISSMTMLIDYLEDDQPITRHIGTKLIVRQSTAIPFNSHKDF